MKLSHQIILLLLISLASSCTVVKKHRPLVPFVFENKINIAGKFPADVKSSLKDRLEDQIEDSVSPVVKDVMFIRHVIQRPAAFDTMAVYNPQQNMIYLLRNNGFFRGEVKANWKTDTVKKDQVRVTVNYDVVPGKAFKIDSVGYAFQDSTLQALAQKNNKNSFLKKGENFSNELVSKELDRLTKVFKENGYYKISREEMIGERDTAYTELISLEMDPFLQIKSLQEAEKRLSNPSIDIIIKQVTPKDSTRLKRYLVGNVTLMPDFPVDITKFTDTPRQRNYGKVSIYSFENRFKDDFILGKLALDPGKLYDQRDLNQTLINYNRIEAWQSSTLRTEINDTIPSINFMFQMVPAKRYQFSTDIEASSYFNTSQIVIPGGNKGLSLNFTLKHRNLGKRAITLSNTLRTGIEFNDFSEILSSEISLYNRFMFPWLLAPKYLQRKTLAASPKSFVSFDFSYLNRFNYFEILNFNTFLGYEWNTRKQSTWQVRFANFEYNKFLDIDSGFVDLLQDFPLLRYSYNTGMIIGINGSITKRFTGKNSNNVSSLRIFGEESGVLSGYLFENATEPGKALDQLYRFVKTDVDFRHYINNKKTQWAFRAFGGIGVGFPTKNSQLDQVTMPFFKQYFAGGPNSMRGWQLRKLGIGTNAYYDTVANGEFNDRYADVQLEGNAEYRFDILPFFGFSLKGALFMDVGNIWMRNNLDGKLEGAAITWDTFYESLAVAGGGGFRIDFTYLLLRFDFGWKLKDPLYALEPGTSPDKAGWFLNKNMGSPTFHFAIGYPF